MIKKLPADLQDEYRRRQKSRNRAMLVALLMAVAIFYIWGAIKF